mgnify:CR=1 FL=1
MRAFIRLADKYPQWKLVLIGHEGEKDTVSWAQAQAEDDDATGDRREPIDIPRFLNRQNNQ